MSSSSTTTCSSNNSAADDTAIVDAALAVLAQCRAFLQSIPTTQCALYAKESTRVPQSTLGKHTRHSLDHFLKLVAGIRDVADARDSGTVRDSGTTRDGNTSTDTFVDYDRRERNVPMETDVSVAIDALRRLSNDLRQLFPVTSSAMSSAAASAAISSTSTIHTPPHQHSTHLLHAPISPRVMVHAQSDNNNATITLPSTIARELWFVTHHAIHHHAMMKVIAEEMGLVPPVDFGLAPSTARFRRSEK